jgi:hypothetical protein
LITITDGKIMKLAALFLDAEWKCVHTNMEMDREERLISSNIKYLTVHYFLRKSLIKIILTLCFWKSINTIKNK